MFHRILIPLDGSTRAEQAIPLAARLARASGGALFFLRVIDTIHEVWIAAPSPLLAAGYLQDIEEQQRSDARAYLTEKIAAGEFAGMERHERVVSGPAAFSILEVVQQEQIDLVVLCSHGLTGFKRWAMGSVAQQVARHSPAPVLLLREQNLHLRDKVAQPVQTAVALDGSPFAEAALLPAAYLTAALSSPAEGELLLLQVIHLPTTQQETAYQQYEREVNLRQILLGAAHGTLQAASAALSKKLAGQLDIQIARAVIEDGDVAEALLQAVEGGKAHNTQPGSDLLALTTHGRSGIQRWMLGSVAERVLQGSTLPLLIVHPPDAA